MSERRRDRHGRGLRGPLAVRNPLTQTVLRPAQPAGRAAFFDEAVHSAIEQVRRNCPDALAGVRFGIEDVPYLETAWSGDRVPLASALEPSADQPAQLVLYRRPLEHRAATRHGLQILVFRTLVEQLAALSGRSVEDLDPEGLGEDD